jgi:hypothetical protein
MRVYALLFGLALTSAYGYAAQVAVASASAGRRGDVSVGAAAAAPGDPIWYGGVIDPITVESGSTGTKVTAAKRWLQLDAPAGRCLAASRPYHAVI